MSIFELNLHPLVVHFPIALLSLYCFIEIVSFGWLKLNQNLVFTKAVLATVGGLSLLVARQFGEQSAKDITNPQLVLLVEKHELFSNYSAIVFGIIGVVYLFVLFTMIIGPARLSGIPGFNTFTKIQKLVTETFLANTLALVGLVFLTITGALGGAIVYGPYADPVTNFVYHLFF